LEAKKSRKISLYAIICKIRWVFAEPRPEAEVLGFAGKVGMAPYSGRWPTARRTRQIDPNLPLMIGPMNARKALENGLRLKVPPVDTDALRV
jgi:hypothetical protein